MKDLAIKAALVVCGVALAVYLTRKASTAVADAAGDALQAVNPWNQDNVIYQTASNAVQAASGGKWYSPGDMFFSLFNPEKDDINSAYYNPPKVIDPYDVRFYRPPPQDVAGNFEISPYAIAP